MDKLIQPLSDILRQYPDLSAKMIILVSVIFTAIASACVFLQEQAKTALKERIETQKTTREQYEKLHEILQSRIKLTLDLDSLNEEMIALKEKNRDLETNKELSKLQRSLEQMITVARSNVEDINKAVSTQDSRRDIFIKSRQAQKKSYKNLFGIFRK